jgi:hypothetical protein
VPEKEARPCDAATADRLVVDDGWIHAPSPFRELPFLWLVGLFVALVCGRRVPDAATATRLALAGDGGLGAILGLNLAFNIRGAADFMARRAARRPFTEFYVKPVLDKPVAWRRIGVAFALVGVAFVVAALAGATMDGDWLA